MSGRPSPAELIERPGAMLSRTDLRELGLPRRAVDACFRALPVIVLPGYSRPLILAADFRAWLAEHTYRDDRVRPIQSEGAHRKAPGGSRANDRPPD